MPDWTITGGVFTDTVLATALINRVRFTIQNGGQDSLSLFVARDADDTAPFDAADDVTLSYNGTVRWRGYVRAAIPAASGAREGWTVECEGAMGNLARVPYTQRIATAGASGTYKYVSEVVLGYNNSGTRLNLADCIADILDTTATDHGLTSGTILPAYTTSAPLTQMTDATVWDALHRMTAWAPEAVLYFDHSANSVNLKKPGSLSNVSTAGSGDGGADGKRVVEVRIDQKKRFPVRGVKIIWRVHGSYNGEEMVDTTEDTAGATTGKDRVVMTINLVGRQVQVQEQEVKTDGIPRVVADYTATQWRTFCQKYIPELSGWTSEDTALEVFDCTHTVDSANKTGGGTIPQTGSPAANYYPRQLLNGTVPAWETSLSTAPVSLRIKVRPGATAHNLPALRKVFHGNKEWTREFVLNVTGTDAQSQTYRRLVRDTGGETPPTGMAADWYAALQTSAPACQISFAGTEPRLDILPGNTLTLTGDIAVTAAVVQAVTVDVDAGITTVSCGPQGRLTPADLVELMRAANRRTESVQQSATYRTSATPSGTTHKGPSGTANANNSSAVPDPMAPAAWVTINRPGFVDVTAGCVMVTEVSTPDELDPEPVKILKRLLSGGSPSPAAASALAIAHNETVWLKLTYTETEYGTETVKTRVRECTAAAYEVAASVTETALISYIPLAKYTVASDTPSLDYTHPGGPVVAPSLTMCLPGEVTAGIEPYFFASITGADEVTIAAGRIHYDEIDMTVIPQSAFSSHGLGTTATAMTALDDSDYIWLRCTRELAYIDEEFQNGDDLTMYSRRARIHFGEYFIESGPAVPALGTYEHIWPLAWYVGGEVIQLHVGVATLPAVFASSVSVED